MDWGKMFIYLKNMDLIKNYFTKKILRKSSCKQALLDYRWRAELVPWTLKSTASAFWEKFPQNPHDTFLPKKERRRNGLTADYMTWTWKRKMTTNKNICATPRFIGNKIARQQREQEPHMCVRMHKEKTHWEYPLSLLNSKWTNYVTLEFQITCWF